MLWCWSGCCGCWSGCCFCCVCWYGCCCRGCWSAFGCEVLVVVVMDVVVDVEVIDVVESCYNRKVTLFALWKLVLLKSNTVCLMKTVTFEK